MTLKLDAYLADNEEFGWRALDGNHRSVAVGGETFTRDDDVFRSLRNVIAEFKALPDDAVDLLEAAWKAAKAQDEMMEEADGCPNDDDDGGDEEEPDEDDA